MAIWWVGKYTVFLFSVVSTHVWVTSGVLVGLVFRQVLVFPVANVIIIFA